jgi:hypothetical protein
MAGIFVSISHWWTNHPTFAFIATAVVTVVLSLYAQEIRRLLHWPFRFAGKHLSESITNEQQSRQSYLAYFHNDSYKLVLFLAWYVLRSLTHGLWYGFLALLSAWFIFHINLRFEVIAVSVLVADGVKLQSILQDAMGWWEPQSGFRSRKLKK